MKLNGEVRGLSTIRGSEEGAAWDGRPGAGRGATREALGPLFSRVVNDEYLAVLSVVLEQMAGGYPQEPGKARLFERYVHLLQRYISRKISFGVSGCINLEIRISVWKASLAARGSPSN